MKKEVHKWNKKQMHCTAVQRVSLSGDDTLPHRRDEPTAGTGDTTPEWYAIDALRANVFGEALFKITGEDQGERPVLAHVCGSRRGFRACLTFFLSFGKRRYRRTRRFSFSVCPPPNASLQCHGPLFIPIYQS